MWADIGGVGVGYAAGGHILSIVTGVLKSKKANLVKAAEIYAKTGIVFKDGPLIIWRGKYEYNLGRPITYINKLIDPTWQPYYPNPPYPEYPAGLAKLYSSSMQILIREYGDIPVTDDTYKWRGVPPRYYSSISKLNLEVGISRVYAGVHYQFTQDITREMGKELGNKIADIYLIPKN